ncbi:hypothetical protein KVE25_00300 [Helicobacter pylori]|nr:hypothetical protein KVE25_00300 [Helicobacter pylori]
MDTKLKEMLALWQIEGGTLICDDNQILSIPTNKIKAITSKNAITFCYFKAEKERLNGIANVYHYTKHSEGYKEWHRLHRELERMMGIVEFHFYDDNHEKKEILTFSSYQQMIDTMKEKLKETKGNKWGNIPA